MRHASLFAVTFAVLMAVSTGAVHGQEVKDGGDADIAITGLKSWVTGTPPLDRFNTVDCLVKNMTSEDMENFRMRVDFVDKDGKVIARNYSNVKADGTPNRRTRLVSNSIDKIRTEVYYDPRIKDGILYFDCVGHPSLTWKRVK